MIVLEPGIIVTLGLSFVGMIVWAVRVEGKVTGHDKAFLDMNKLLDERDNHLKERHVDLIARLVRIETAIDKGFKNGNH